MPSALCMCIRAGAPLFPLKPACFSPLRKSPASFLKTTRSSTTKRFRYKALRPGSELPMPWAILGAIILRNHGLLTVGDSVAEAVGSFIQMERVVARSAYESPGPQAHQPRGRTICTKGSRAIWHRSRRLQGHGDGGDISVSPECVVN